MSAADLRAAARKWRRSMERTDEDRERMLGQVRAELADGMSQAEAARIVGVSRQRLNDILHGRR